jgi:hypothetical protein
MGVYTCVQRGARSRFGRRLLGFAVGAAVVVVPAIVSPALASATVGVTGYQIVHGDTTTVMAGQSVAANASCGPGKVVTSGGVVSHSPLTFISTSYPLSSTTWRVVVTDTGSQTYPESFTPYAVCVNASSVPGYHQVQTAPLPVGPNTYYGPNLAIGDAYCGAQEVVIGGGVLTHNPSTLLTITRPTTDDQAWEVEVHLTNPPASGREYYQVSSVCIPSADVSSYSLDDNPGGYGTGLTQAMPSDTAGSGYCAAGTLAVAGGATNHDQQNGFISSISPASGGQYWLATDTDINPPSYGESFDVTAVCVTGTT